MIEAIKNRRSIRKYKNKAVNKATAQGLGSLWICDSFFAQEELSDWAGGELYAILAVGYADEAPEARPRKKAEDIIEWRA